MAIPWAANQESNCGSVRRITDHRAHLWNLPPAWKFTPPSCRNAIPASTIVQIAAGSGVTSIVPGKNAPALKPVGVDRPSNTSPMV